MFVLPIIVESEKPSAPKAIGESIRFFKHTWGENIATKATVNIPLSLINFALLFATGLLVLPFIFAGLVWVAIFLFVLWLLFSVVLGVIGSFANSLINVALYYYASTGQVPPAFSADLLNNVFIKRKHFLKKPKT
jgi:hypothetical protein